MGVSFLWLSLRIPPELTSRVATRFAEAVAASPVSPTARRVLERWRESPNSLIPEFVPDPARPGALTHAEGTVDFEELFRPEALSGFGREFFLRGVAPEEWGVEPDWERASIIMTDRIPAAAALYFGLGAERVARLPGHFGAFFVAPSDVGQVLPLVDSVIGTPSPEMLTRARRWLEREGLLLLTARG